MGLDVHKKTIAVATVEGGASADVRFFGTIPNTPEAIRSLLRKLGKGGQRLHLAYEAAPLGYNLYRLATGLGHRATWWRGLWSRGRLATRSRGGLELGRDAILDETTILNFRHLLERHELTKAVFAAVAEHLEAQGALLRGGTIVDATLIAASPSPSTKNNR